MKHENEKKLQQDAFMWFKSQYGKTPADCGMKAAVPRVKRLFIFFRWRQVVFAPDRETADAFDKGQKIMETAFSGMLVLPLFALLGLIALLTQSVLLCGVVILLCLAALIAVVAGYLTVKPLEKLYWDRVVVYTA